MIVVIVVVVVVVVMVMVVIVVVVIVRWCVGRDKMQSAYKFCGVL